MEHIRNGLYALAIAIVASTIIFSWSLTSAAGTIGTGLANGGIGLKGTIAAGPVPTAVVSVAPTPAPTAAVVAPQGKLSFADAATRGSDSAKVVIVEYSDFQCPFCERFFTQTESQISKDYIDTGKVRLIYKNFPLDSIHPNARPAAIAAECVRKVAPDKYWPFHDKLFQNQAALGEDNYKKWAGELGVDATKFSACYTAKETNPLIDAQFAEGAQNGIQGTPGFKLTNSQGGILQEVSGAQPYAVFKQAIDAALASAG